MATNKKKILRYGLIILGIGVYLFFFIRNNFRTSGPEGEQAVDEELVYRFKNLHGPEGASVVPARRPTSWRTYNGPGHYGIGVLLTDTNSAWLGLVHGFKNFGIPFNLYTNADSALRHQVVLLYPLVSGRVLNAGTLEKLAGHLREGHTLIGINVLGGISEAFGIGEAIPARNRFEVRLSDSTHAFLREFRHPREKTLSLGNRHDFKETIGTHAYTQPLTRPLLTYANGDACLTQYYYKTGGAAFALGIDLGEFVLRSQNERGFNAQRSYVNEYEPSVDVLLRIIKNIYADAVPDAVFIHPVPGGKALPVCLTHDIDFTRSIINAVKYAEMEKEKGVKATYFIQTKYIKDWNDDVFFNERGADCARQIAALGMELGSHSVAHSHVFSKFEMGSGRETYPEYAPFVMGRDSALHGTILGELRVSKFLLENQVKGAGVVSFRSGHLSYPFSLPQALQATGFRYSSCVTANNVLSHLPYQLQYNRESDEEMELFEFPVTLEDEEKPRMDQRLDKALALARQLKTYGGLMNVLIHTDTLACKLSFETQLIDSLRDDAWFGSLNEYASWWKVRNSVQLQVSGSPQKPQLIISARQTLAGLALELPAQWKCISLSANVSQRGRRLLIQKLDKPLVLDFALEH